MDGVHVPVSDIYTHWRDLSGVVSSTCSLC